MLNTVMTVGWSLGAFIVALGALVAFHEYGHFWVARRLGVKVLRYSVGFGKPIWMRTAGDGTEYAIARIPLGGYVRFLDEREADVPEAERHLAFNTQPVWKRILIVAAGPAANLLLAVILAWAVLVIGSNERVAAIADVPADTIAAEAGLAGGERIVSIGGKSVSSWADLNPALVGAAIRGKPTLVEVVDADGAPRSVTLDLTDVPAEPETLYPLLGLAPAGPQVPPVLAMIEPDSAAARAGLAAGDRLLSGASDGQTQTFETWGELVPWLRERPGDLVTLTWRDAQSGARGSAEVLLGSVETEQGTVGQLGARVDVSQVDWTPYRTTVRLDPLSAIPAAFTQTWDWTKLTVRMIGLLFTGDVSLKNVSGPIQIAEVTGYAAQLGLAKFLAIAGIISISLGVLNLMPIPVLDGGHLLYYFVEVIKGSPVSERVQLAGQQIGLVLLFMLMSLAFYNDIARLVGAG